MSLLKFIGGVLNMHGQCFQGVQVQVWFGRDALLYVNTMIVFLSLRETLN